MLPSTLLPLILHIPHSGIEIPSSALAAFGDRALLERERNRVTDWFTDELFDLPGALRCATPISRLVVDLERYCDDQREPRAAVGQGVIYTHASSSERLRARPTAEQREALLDQWYRPWQLKLEVDVISQWQQHGTALLIDAHSFPATPLRNEDDQGRDRPDICLGTGPNTPEWLLEAALRWCEKHAFSVAVNFPYAGCLVPERYVGRPQLPAIMIEVNRALYLTQPNPDLAPQRSRNFWRIKALLSELLLGLCAQTVNRIPHPSDAA